MSRNKERQVDITLLCLSQRSPSSHLCVSVWQCFSLGTARLCRYFYHCYNLPGTLGTKCIAVVWVLFLITVSHVICYISDLGKLQKIACLLLDFVISGYGTLRIRVFDFNLLICILCNIPTVHMALAPSTGEVLFQKEKPCFLTLVLNKTVWFHHVATGDSDLRNPIILNHALICHLHKCVKEMSSSCTVFIYLQTICLLSYLNSAWLRINTLYQTKNLFYLKSLWIIFNFSVFISFRL